MRPIDPLLPRRCERRRRGHLLHRTGCRELPSHDALARHADPPRSDLPEPLSGRASGRRRLRCGALHDLQRAGDRGATGDGHGDDGGCGLYRHAAGEKPAARRTSGADADTGRSARTDAGRGRARSRGRARCRDEVKRRCVRSAGSLEPLEQRERQRNGDQQEPTQRTAVTLLQACEVRAVRAFDKVILEPAALLAAEPPVGCPRDGELGVRAGQLVLELLGERAARPEEEGLERSRRDAEDLRDLGVRACPRTHEAQWPGAAAGGSSRER